MTFIQWNNITKIIRSKEGTRSVHKTAKLTETSTFGNEHISRAWCKTIVHVTTSFYIRRYNSFAPSPRFGVASFITTDEQLQ